MGFLFVCFFLRTDYFPQGVKMQCEITVQVSEAQFSPQNFVLLWFWYSAKN